MSDETQAIQQIREEMSDTISPTFCLAKWHHTSIYLHTGQTHSCYHPRPHVIPLDTLRMRPSSLHNTPEKQQERAQMLVGERPRGCQYCWNVEDLGPSYISDRMIRNHSISLGRPELVEEILTKPWDFHVNPEYIELAFSSECNFKCGYCHPMSSSKFFAEIVQHGPYSMVKHHTVSIEGLSVYTEETNPYLQAWWAWWPEVSQTLNILRITGGEPLLHKSTWRLFDELANHPKPQLELNINSNLGAPTKWVQQLVDRVCTATDQQHIRHFQLFSSMDTWGARAEYLRTGLDLTLWEHNMDTYIRGTHRPLSIMCTFNILSVTSFRQFLEKILEWRATYDTLIPTWNSQQPYERKIRFDTPYLKEPLQYDMHLLPKEDFLPYFDEILNFIQINMNETDVTKFSQLEYERFRRVRDYFATTIYDAPRIREGRIDFYRWFTEYDRRRHVSFEATFPELHDFWMHCQQLAI